MREKRWVLSLSVLLWAATSADAVVVRMTNSSGGDSLALYLGLSGEMQIRVETAAIDTIPISFVIAFLDVGGATVGTEVTAVEGGAPATWLYDRSAFELPAALDDDPGNEYGLISGDQFGVNPYPLGSAVHIHDVLTLTQTSSASGVLAVTFELGARAPLMFGPPPEYAPFIVGGCDFPPCPDRLFVGDEAGNNTPFLIFQGVPEPSLALGLVGACCLLIRRHR